MCNYFCARQTSVSCILLLRFFQAMQETVAQDPSRNYFLIDGFPRNQDNLQGWNQEMGDKTNLLFVLYFECDEKVRQTWLSGCFFKKFEQMFVGRECCPTGLGGCLTAYDLVRAHPLPT